MSQVRTASNASLLDSSNARQDEPKRARLPSEVDWSALAPKIPHPPKQYQRDAATAILKGKDVLLIAPTGSGKGYILQLLLLLMPKKRFVVLEPLQILQEELSERMGDEAIFLHADNRTPELLKDIKGGKYRMIFISPEMAVGNAFRSVLMDEDFQAQLGAVVFDEAQVLKDWAVDSSFRKGIKEISALRHMAQVPGLAMSGTLPEAYRKEVRTYFELHDEVVLDLGVDRPNIELIVAPMQHTMNTFRDVLAWLPEIHGTPPTNAEEVAELRRSCKPTIVYCNNKTHQLELFYAVKQWYSRVGIGDSVALVSADMSKSHRSQIKRLVEEGRILCVISTSALGMGSDMPRIVRVIHWRLTDSLASIMQRIGRAGRNPTTTSEGIILADRKQEGKGAQDEEEAADAGTESSRAVRVEHAKETLDGKKQLLDVVDHAQVGCIRALVNKLLGQPSPENCPSAEEIFGPSIVRGPCCSFCSGRSAAPLPSVFDEPEKDSARARDNIGKLQEHVEPKLRQWRTEMWRTKWSKETALTWLGPAHFLRMEDVSSIVRHLGKIDRSFAAGGDGGLDRYVATGGRREVVPQLTEWLKTTVAEYDAGLERVRQEKQAAAEKARDEREREKLRKQAAKKMEKASANAEAGGSTKKVYSCKACMAWNREHPDKEPLDAKGHTSAHRHCPAKKMIGRSQGASAVAGPSNARPSYDGPSAASGAGAGP